MSQNGKVNKIAIMCKPHKEMQFIARTSSNPMEDTKKSRSMEDDFNIL